MEKTYVNLKDQLGEEDRERINDLSQHFNSFEEAVQMVLKNGIKTVMDHENLSFNRLDAVEIEPEIEKQLNKDQKLLYRIIKKNPGINLASIYEMYDKEKEWPKTRPRLRDYIKDMEQKELIQGEGNPSRPDYEVIGI